TGRWTATSGRSRSSSRAARSDAYHHQARCGGDRAGGMCRSGEIRMNATALAIVLLLSAAKADSDQAKQDEVLAAIRARLAAVAQNDTAAWSRWVADDMITPLEGATPSKAAWMKAH